MSDDELLAWLRLVQAPGVGPGATRRLLAAFGSPQAVLRASPASWREVAGHEAATGLAQNHDDIATLHASTVAWLRAAPETRHVVTLGDPAYPDTLLQIADPPVLLYAEGCLDLMRAESLAIVGSRHATPPGRDNARQFATHLSQGGLCIVSGMALGIDGAAHEGALVGSGSTVAVVGTGLEQVYPARHKALAARIVTDGLVLSEYPLGTPPLAQNFPRRNRIIAGLTRGTLVVEAAVQSGSLITARLAMEGGREVFAIPGSIHSPQSRGCHRLIQQGAKLVETAADILQELQWPSNQATTIAAAAAATDGASPLQGLLDAMGHDPVTLDALVARIGYPPAELNGKLLDLELDGRVARLPGGLFQQRQQL
ncbi:MAG: DNA-processing protein DprA [Vitreoscilla sp.]|nr:DNA-processing protein DprA [Vitreoscilla sp.]